MMTPTSEHTHPTRRAAGHRSAPAASDRSTAPTDAQSPTVTKFEKLARQLFRAAHQDRPRLRREVADAVRASGYPLRCVNALVGEAVCRGGPDGLDLAADVLARVPAPTRTAVGEFLRNDRARRKRDNGLGHPRHTTHNEAWYALLVGLARSDTPAIVVFLGLRRVAAEATDGMREPLAAAARELGRRADGRGWARRLLGDMTSAEATRDVPLSHTSAEAVAQALDDLGD